jgi:hypothetical protein
MLPHRQLPIFLIRYNAPPGFPNYAANLFEHLEGSKTGTGNARCRTVNPADADLVGDMSSENPFTKDRSGGYSFGPQSTTQVYCSAQAKTSATAKAEINWDPA